jgi:hypothetical protein
VSYEVDSCEVEEIDEDDGLNKLEPTCMTMKRIDRYLLTSE